MKNAIVLLCILSAALMISCSKDNSEVKNNPDIISISSHYTGGWGINYETIIRKDSIIFFDSSTLLNGHVKHIHIKNDNNTWNSIIKSFKLQSFTKLQNGESVAAADGADRTIIIKTNSNTYSKMNAETSPVSALIRIVDSIEENMQN